MILNEQEIFVTRPSMPDFEKYCETIKPLWDSRCLTNMGVLHSQFEERLKSCLDVDNISLFVNGHLALEMTLQAMDLKGDVITTPFSFSSSTHAIVRNNLTPIFCDIKENDFTLDPQKLERLITEKTCAIVPVHVYGNVCEIEEIEKIARRYSLKVIYDAAHAFGVTYKGRGIGSYGDATMFSFHATKIFHSIEGGAVASSKNSIHQVLYGLKNFGIMSPENVTNVGANAKMNEFQAAMGLCNLDRLNVSIQERKRIVDRYAYWLADVPGLYSTCWTPVSHVKPNYAYAPLIVKKEQFGASRNEIIAYLNENGVFPRKYFYPLISDYACYSDRFSSAKTPQAQIIAEQVLTLPLYEEMQNEQVDRICRLILNKKNI